MVKLVCYNIEYCEGIEGIWYQYLKFWRIFYPPKNLDSKIIEALKNIRPDILALVEVDTGSFRSKKKDQVEYFGKELGMIDLIEKVKYPIHGWLKLFHYVPILNKQANAIVSKYKFSNVKYHIFHRGTKRMVLEAKVTLPNHKKKITLILTHLSLGKKARKLQFEELKNIINKIKGPVILMGDFNTFRGESEIYELLNSTKLTDKAELSTDSKILTQPSWHPKRRLDYILVSPEIKVKKYKVLDFHFSDHKPLFVEFFIK